jgi:hypothetical protein
MGRDRPPPAHTQEAAPLAALGTLGLVPANAAPAAVAPADHPDEAPELDVLADIDFSETGGANSFLADGWSHQEPLFIWALGQTSEIVLPDTSGWSDVTLDLHLFPCILPPYRTVQRLRLRADGVEIGQAEIEAPCRVTIASPQGMNWGRLNRLTVIHPDGIVPSELPGETDGRCLTLAFQRLTFRGRRLAGAAGDMVPKQASTPEDADVSDKDMILQFEGLGGTAQGCEFGLLQRELGAEPLSLLRWTLMNAESLAEALESDFAGVGTPEQTMLDYFEWPDFREYCTEDRRFLMKMHTWVREDEKPFDAMFKMMCRRLTFLRDKLLDDLAAAGKIFVFKMGDRMCTPEQVARIHQALRRHGPNTLLYVRLADHEHPDGTVEQVQEGLFIGYISHFNQAPDGQARKLARASWLAICRETHRIWQTTRSIPETEAQHV